MGSTLNLLSRLKEHEVDFIIVGGVAGVLHGSSIVTRDLDICAPFTLRNLSLILTALSGLSPRFRMTPDRRPMSGNPEDYLGYKNLSLVTDWGQLDILSEITGIGDYRQVSQHTITVDLGGNRCHVLDLDTLILSKKSLDQPKSRHALIELEAIRECIRDRSH